MVEHGVPKLTTFTKHMCLKIKMGEYLSNKLDKALRNVKGRRRGRGRGREGEREGERERERERERRSCNRANLKWKHVSMCG